MGRLHCESIDYGAICRQPAGRRIVYLDGVDWNDTLLCPAHTLEWLHRLDRPPVTLVESLSFKAVVEQTL